MVDEFDPPFPEMFARPKRQPVKLVSPLLDEVEPISVLFVDKFNQVRSVLAQAQAEIIRLWTLNQYGYNLFSCVDSAGLRVSTPLTRSRQQDCISSGKAPNRTAIDALFGQPEPIKEKEDIRYRILHQQTSRGITYEDFDTFDYIFAFDKDSLADLRKLHWIAHERALQHGRSGVNAKTRLIGEYNPYGKRNISLPILDNPFPATTHDFASTIIAIEKELYNFLQAKKKWTPPEAVASGALNNRYRSRQFLARDARVTESKVNTLRLLYGNISVDKEVKGRDTRVVTVTARDGQRLKEALDDARLVLT